jgi:N-acetylmuramoyl-L-alanine amidase
MKIKSLFWPQVLILLFLIFILASISYGAVNVNGLKGRIIVVDPGHGPDSGAFGLNGLTERELNLKVAQYLKEMLADKGAIVYLTRENDKGPYNGEKMANHELAARIKLASELKCDLFVSIHHNANAQEDRSINQTEIYYNVNDFSASRDIADLLMDSLTRELNTQRGYPASLPAEYYVLRNAGSFPAVLGEAAYIINPQAEALLSREEYQKKEALGYFKAIEAYFNRGIPSISDIFPKDGAILTDLSKFEISARITDEKGGSGIDPSSIRVLLDGHNIDTKFAGEKLTGILDKPLSSGNHEIQIEARNKNGNSVPVNKTHFLVQLPAEKIQLSLTPAVLPPDNKIDISLEASLLDRNGNYTGYGIPVVFTEDGKYIGTAYTEKGIARIRVNGKPYISTTQFTASAGNISSTTTLVQKYSEEGMITGSIKNTCGFALSSVKIKLAQAILAESNSDGKFYLEHLNKGKYSLILTAPGYTPKVLVAEVNPGEITELEVQMQPYLDGILQNKTYVIDAAFGGSLSGPVGPGGLSAAETNLKVAKYLRHFLIQAGATVYMTREDLESMTDIQKVVMDVTTNNKLFLTINYGKGLSANDNYAAIYHFPGQKTELCQRILQEITQTFNTPVIPYQGKYGKDGIIDNSDYLIVQTYGIRVEPSLITNPDEEKKLKNPSYLQKQAYAIFNALLLDEGIDTTQTGSITGFVSGEANNMIGNAAVELDDGTVLLTDSLTTSGQYQFKFVKFGPHRVTVSAPGYQPQVLGVIVKQGETVQLDFKLSPSQK